MVTVGIDFGFSSIRVAIFCEKTDDEVARVELLCNDLGERSTPTVIAFDSGLRIFGRDAITNAALFPENFVFGIKRIIGRYASDQELRRHLANCHFEKFHGCESDRLTIGVKGDNFYPRHPEELLSFILLRIKEMAEQEYYAMYGEQKSVENAVISVPTYFNHNQRLSVLNAAKIADINVLQLINDSTAAAVNYVFDVLEGSNRKLLIFDFGASSLDVALIDVNKFDITVMAAAGSTSLGGVDFDNCLMAHCIEHFKAQCQRDLSNDKRLLHKLRLECETAKKTLQSKSEARIKIDVSDKEQIDMTVKRDEFDRMCKHLYSKAISFVKKVVEESGMKKSDIQDVILVGTSSRLKRIENLIIEYLNGKRINRRLNVEEAVVNGATLLAAKLRTRGVKDKKLEQMRISEVTPFRVGIKKAKLQDDGDLYPTVKKLKTSPVTIFIDRNEKVPATQDGDVIEDYIDVVAGDSHKMFEYQKITTLGLSNASRNRLDKLLLNFKIKINVNGVYEFDAKPIDDQNANGKRYFKYIKNIHVTDDEIRLMKDNLLEYKRHVADEEQRVMVKNELQNSLFKVKQEVCALQRVLCETDYELLMAMIIDLYKWIDSHSNATQDEFEHSKLRVKNIKDHLEDYRAKAEAVRLEALEELKAALQKLAENIGAVKDIIDASKVQLISEEGCAINDWMLSNAHETRELFREKITKVISIEKKLATYVDEECKLREEMRQSLIDTIMNTLKQSFFEKYKHLDHWKTCKSDLLVECSDIERILDVDTCPSSAAITKLKQRFAAFIDAKANELQKEESLRRQAEIQLRDVTIKLRKLSVERSKVKLTKFADENINQLVTETEQWLKEGLHSKIEYEEKCDLLRNEYSLIYDKIKQDDERIAARKQLHEDLSNFRRQYLPDEKKAKFQHGAFESLKKTFSAVEKWYTESEMSPMEEINEKMIELSNLKQIADGLMKHEDDRLAKRRELEDALRNFRQQFLQSHYKTNFRDDDFKSLNAQITDMNKWYTENEFATIDDMNQKIEELRELKITAQELIELKKQVSLDVEKIENEPAFVGIDIGTSYCRLCIFRNGQYEVMTFDGYPELPSYVAFGKCDLLFGNEAKNNLFTDARNTFFNIKRLIGRRRSRDLEEDVKYLKYFVNTQLEKLKVLATNAGKYFAVEEITALIMLKMKLTAEEYLKKEVTEVTISVPSMFCNSQRQATHDAAIIAGFKEVKLVNDTVAIALRYVWDNFTSQNVSRENKNVLVFSMGAGFTSVSILSVKDSCIEVKMHGGEFLGGYDLDKALCEYVLKKYRGNINDMDFINFVECESSKIELSRKLDTYAVVDKHYGKTHGIFVTRNNFDTCSKSIFGTIFDTVRDTMKAAKMDRSQVDEVFVCGGSSNLYMVDDFFTKYTTWATKRRFGDDSVAIGCAIYAMTTKTDFNIIKFNDRLNYSYKLEIRHGEPLIVDAFQNLPAINEAVIRANTNYQHSYTTYLYEIAKNQKVVISDKVLQTSAVSKDEIVFKVTMEVDKSGLLSVTAVDSGSKTETFYVKSRLSEDEIQRMIIDFEKYRNKLQRAKYVAIEKKKLLEKIDEYQNLLVDLRKYVKSSELFIGEKALARASTVLNDDRCTADMCESSRQRLISAFRAMLDKKP